MLAKLSESELVQLSDNPETSMTIPCMDPWWLARSQPNCEQLAKQWLEREGFEVWYPQGKHVTAKPQRNLPSKTRYKRRYEFQERLKPAYPGYLLIRRMFGSYPIRQIYELPHVGGLCMFRESAALVPDYEVEMIRRDEAGGVFNTYDAVSERRYVGVETSLGDQKRWNGESRLIGRLANSHGVVAFVERLGRVSRVITSPDDIAAASP